MRTVYLALVFYGFCLAVVTVISGNPVLIVGWVSWLVGVGIAARVSLLSTRARRRPDIH